MAITKSGMVTKNNNDSLADTFTDKITATIPVTTVLIINLVPKNTENIIDIF